MQVSKSAEETKERHNWLRREVTRLQKQYEEGRELDLKKKESDHRKAMTDAIKTSVREFIDTWPDEIKAHVEEPSEEGWQEGPVHALGAILHHIQDSILGSERREIDEAKKETGKALSRLVPLQEKLKDDHLHEIQAQIRAIRKTCDRKVAEIRALCKEDIRVLELQLRKGDNAALAEVRSERDRLNSDYEDRCSKITDNYRLLRKRVQEIKDTYGLE